MAGAGEAFHDIAGTLRTLPRSFVGDAVGDIESATLKMLRAVTGGDQRLSRAGNRQLTVETRIAGGTSVTGTLTAGPPKVTAQWDWLETGIRPHGNHPGKRPLHAWSRPVGRTLDSLVDDLADRFAEAFR